MSVIAAKYLGTYCTALRCTAGLTRSSQPARMRQSNMTAAADHLAISSI